MSFAVAGKILWVNLTRGTFEIKEISPGLYEKFLSGSGLASCLLYQAIPSHADPLGAQNVLGFVSGLLTCTNAFFGGRWMAVAKSPLTGTWGESNCGGNFSAGLKSSGLDGIYFEGISPKPVYLLVENSSIEIRDASHLWGTDAIETQETLHRELSKDHAIACIGPAGENLSLISGICNDGERLAARSGLGAVMGSKRLKAVALLGKERPAIYDLEQLEGLNKSAKHWVDFKLPLPRSGNFLKVLGTLLRILPFQVTQDGMLYKTLLQIWGTISMNQVSIEMGDSPIQNWSGSSADYGFKRSDSINPDLITRYEKEKYHCTACPLGCGGIVQLPGEEKHRHKPEYETVLSWTGLLLNPDLESLFKINDLLNRGGIDSISAGTTVAFAIECFEKGLLTLQDTGGLELTWGNTPAIITLLEKMIRREGIGDLLADGSLLAARRLKKGSDRFAMQAGGQELAMHDGRNDPGFALHAAVEAAPGRHTHGSQLYYEMFKLWTKVPGLTAPPLLFSKASKYRNPKEKAAWAAACSKYMQFSNGCGFCLFGGFIGVNRIPMFEYVNAVTGWNRSPQEYMEIGARIHTLKQAFNARQGAPLRHTVNPRLLGIPSQSRGANRSRSLNLDEMITEYWLALGWNPETGFPTPQTLKDLGLEEIVPFDQRIF